MFHALGFLPFFLYRNLSNQLGASFDANEALLTFPIVKEIDTVMARALLEIATSLVVMVLAVSLIIFIDGAPLPDDPLKLMEAFLYLSILGTGIGLCNAVLISKFQSWQNIYQMLNTPLLITSGVFFSLETIPTKLRDILSWNPIIHGVEGLRDGYYLNYRGSNIDMSYLLWWGLVSLLIGLAAERGRVI